MEKETTKARFIPALKELLEKEGRLFSKEIEVLYDLKANEVRPFIQKALPADTFAVHEILGELYIERS